MDLHVRDTLATKLQHYIDTNVANTPTGVIEKALDALDRDIQAAKERPDAIALIERFRKHCGLIKDTRLCDLLEDRREGLL